MTDAAFYIEDLLEYLGDYVDEYDVDAIVDEVTEIDYSTGNRYWKSSFSPESGNASPELWEVCEAYCRLK